jgi:Uri superfamily endonuclease
MKESGAGRLWPFVHGGGATDGFQFCGQRPSRHSDQKRRRYWPVDPHLDTQPFCEVEPVLPMKIYPMPTPATPT